MGRVCVSLSARNAAEMLAKAADFGRETPFLEFRLDSLEKPQLVSGRLKNFLTDHPLITAIATCRRKANGGEFSGSAAEELEHLIQAAKSGCHIVDLSIETAESLKKDALDKLREAGAAVLLSFHDFKGTPDLEAVYARMAKFAPDFYKVVPTAKTLPDNLKVIGLLEKHAEEANVVGIAMGNCGLLSRVLGPRFGSLFTFASATAGEETAPGQVSARMLNELYRIDSIEAATRIYGVAGSPIVHSLSPLMLNTAFRRETVNAVYVALESGNVKDLLKVVDRLPIHGVSVTMPLKEQVLPFLEKTDPLSAKIGACNTLVRGEDGKLYGFNTDVGGIVGPLERRVPLRGAKVLVLGAGGAARAAVFGLKERGCDVAVLNRTSNKAQKLARQANARVMRRDQLSKTRFDVVINATSYGMHGTKGTPSPLTAEELNCGLFFELVYNPIETPLVRLARAKGIPVILGIEMFVQQGARQFEIWTGKPAPQDEMLRVVLHALRQQAENALPPEPVKPIEQNAPVAKSVVEAKPVHEAKAAAPVKATPQPAKKSATPAVKAAPAKTSAPAAKKAAPVKKAIAKKVIAKPVAKKIAKPVAKKSATKVSTRKTAPAKKPAKKKR
ncbi:MAG: shikimate dehydrogenase [Acidobacteria bacterium]|nr:shikimate dehydrogenase [Acidobacteriota bacterium]